MNRYYESKVHTLKMFLSYYYDIQYSKHFPSFFGCKSCTARGTREKGERKTEVAREGGQGWRAIQAGRGVPASGSVRLNPKILSE